MDRPTRKVKKFYVQQLQFIPVEASSIWLQKMQDISPLLNYLVLQDMYYYRQSGVIAGH